MKKRFMKILLTTSVMALLSMATFLTSCGDNNGRIKLYMVDAPVPGAEAINITLDAVSVNGPDGWFELAVTPHRYNLLDLINNASVLLTDEELPVGDYTEFRLVIECDGDDAPEMIIAGESFPLKVPSGCSSGFKLKGDFTINAGEETILIMDFDMQKSVHQTGNGLYILNPVVRFVQSHTAGNITGEVTPIVPNTLVYAFEPNAFTGDNFDDAINSTIIADDGAFTLAALPAGTYDVVVVTIGYDIAVYVEDVVVVAVQETVLTIPIQMTPTL